MQRPSQPHTFFSRRLGVLKQGRLGDKEAGQLWKGKLGVKSILPTPIGGYTCYPSCDEIEEAWTIEVNSKLQPFQVGLPFVNKNPHTQGPGSLNSGSMSARKTFCVLHNWLGSPGTSGATAEIWG